MAIMENVPGQNAPDRTRRTFLMDDADYDDLEAVARDRDVSSAWLIRHLVAWWLGREGASLPERPTESRPG